MSARKPPSWKALVQHAFQRWCWVNGLRPVRSITVSSLPDDAALRLSKGLWTVELSTRLKEPEQKAVIEAGATHGYAYPLLQKTGAEALEFFQEARRLS